MEDATTLNSLSFENFTSICRGCLCDCRSTVSFNINSFKISEDLVICDVLCKFFQINKEDALPKEFCQQCLQSVTNFYSFINKCQKSEKTLLDVLKQKLTAIKIEKDEVPFHDVEEEISEMPKTEIYVAGIEPPDTQHESIEEVNPSEVPLMGTSADELRIDIEFIKECFKTHPDETIQHTQTKETANTSHTSVPILQSNKIRRTMYCKYCEIQFSAFAEYYDHRKTKHPDLCHLCSVCNKQFFTQQSLKTHVLRHQKEMPYPCKLCTASFPTSGHLREHQVVHSGARPHFCPFCKKDYIRRGDLKKHIHANTGEPPFICGFCKESFEYLCVLKKHWNTAHGVPPDKYEKKQPSKSSFVKGEDGKEDESGHKEAVKIKSVLEHGSRKRHTLHCNQCNVQFVSLKRYFIHRKIKHSRSMSRKQFSFQSNFRHQVLKPRKKGSYLCPFCKMSFIRRWELRNHIAINTEGSPYVCQVCTTMFQQLCVLKKHCDTIHSESARKELEEASEELSNKVEMAEGTACTEADSRKDNQVKETSRSSSKRDRKQMYCQHCNLRFRTLAKYDEHRKTQHPNLCHWCSLCNRYFTNKDSFKTHILGHQKKKPFSCKNCSRSFETLGCLSTHEATHRGKRPYICHFCKNGFIRRGDLKKHLDCSTRKAQYVCDVCNEVFRQFCVLRKHRDFAHTKSLENADKPQCRCHICGETFQQWCDMKQHIGSVHGDPLACPFCEQKFPRQNELARHMLRNSDDYSCETCGEVLESQCLLKKHCDLAHSGPQTCPFCKQMFLKESHLRRHLDQNNGEPPFTCESCGTVFQEQCVLRKHNTEPCTIPIKASRGFIKTYSRASKS